MVLINQSLGDWFCEHPAYVGENLSFGGKHIAID